MLCAQLRVTAARVQFSKSISLRLEHSIAKKDQSVTSRNGGRVRMRLREGEREPVYAADKHGTARAQLRERRRA